MKFYIYTLGCKVNTYESNIMKEQLVDKGYIEDKDADIFIANSCTVTNTSDNKTLKLIRRIRREYPNSLIIVTGCLTQVESKNIEDANIIIGNVGKSNILKYIEEYKNEKIIDIKDIMEQPFEDMELKNFDKTRAFVKIEDGCENYCSYCIIPYTRGKVRSKKKENVIKEVKNLISNGHSEIVLTGIHTGHYFDGDYSFYNLLSDLVKIEGLKRLRISSIEINEITDEIIELFKKEEVLVDHIHIPLQSGSDTILKLMNRKYDKTFFIDRINKIREARPNISITTDIIVGFPNETEELFEETLDTVDKIKFSKIHVFPFSRRKGTKADLMDNQVDEKIAKAREKEIMQIQKRISLSLKRMGENPWQQIEGQFEEGQVVKGTVNKVTTFGAFINIFPGVEALLPVSEMSEENVNPFNMFKVGAEVDVLIKKFTPKEHRIALSIKDIK